MIAALIIAWRGAALSAVGAAAVFSAAAGVFALGLRPLVAKALDLVDPAPKSLQ